MSKKATDLTEQQQLEEVLGQNVSRETLEALNIYKKALFKWNSSINLVSPGTMGDAWRRHFVDSAQLYRLLPDNTAVIYDFGSGAGFPGMVLAILLGDSARVFLCESDKRKCLFLRNVSRETKINASVLDQRIEKIESDGATVPDVISARALASLDKLLALSLPWAEKNPDLILLFLKGQKAEQEILDARKLYNFDVSVVPSCTSDEGRILKIVGLKRKPEDKINATK